jgi:hypothetical protein
MNVGSKNIGFLEKREKGDEGHRNIAGEHERSGMEEQA